MPVLGCAERSYGSATSAKAFRARVEGSVGHLMDLAQFLTRGFKLMGAVAHRYRRVSEGLGPVTLSAWAGTGMS